MSATSHGGSIDRTAVFVDGRSAEEFRGGRQPGARNITPPEVTAAKDDGRLPIEDHNTRIIVFGADAEQARAVVTKLAKNAFHNVAFFAGTLDDLVAGLGESHALGVWVTGWPAYNRL